MSSESTFQNFSKNDHDPNSIVNLTSSVILFAGVLDVSPSIEDYEGPMNTAMEEVFMRELKECHRKNDIMVKVITFNENVEHRSGFAPILNVPANYFHIKGHGRSTALYDAVWEALQSMANYRKILEDQGIDVRSNICIITDGEDICSAISTTTQIKAFLDDLRRKEAWVNSFTITMIGVGQKANYRDACTKMGLDPDKCLVEVSTSAHDIRQMMGVVSQSVSSSSAPSSTPVTF